MLVSPPPGGTPASAPDERSIASQVARDRVKMLYELTPPPLIAGALFAVLVAAMMDATAPSALTVTWLALKLVIAALRAGATGIFRFTAGSSRPLETRRWLLFYGMLMTVDAVSWGGMTVIFLPYSHGIQSTVLLAGAVGVASVAVFTTFSRFEASVVYLVSVLTPIVVDQLSVGGRDNYLTAGALTVYFGVLAFEAWRGQQRQIEMLQLRYVNASIAEQRQQALVLAEHSSAAKSRFLAAVSHEMRTPLNGILGMAQLLRTHVTDAQQAHQLEVMRRSAWHLQNVIADLLDLSRIEFGRLEITHEPFVLAEAVHEVTDLLGAVAADKGLAFHLRFAQPLPERVVGDASRVKQVLHNLLGNAIKFTRHGSVSLEVGASGHMVHFTVSDTGQGVAAEEADRIFDAFAQAGETPARRSGTGLGLTISRQLARAMGGEVRYERAVGGGAVFHFTLAAPHVPAPPPTIRGSSWTARDFRFRGEVLVVDDSPVNAMVACGMLEHFGIDVHTAEDGQEALQLLRTRHFHTVLMDCQMPGMDGFEATVLWRTEEEARGLRRVPIIAVTANAVPGDRERCLAAGMDDYLAKPFDLNELGGLLQRYLKE